MIDFSINNDATIYYELKNNGVGVTSVTGSVFTVTVVNPAGTTIVSAQAPTHVANGIWSYTLNKTLLTTSGTYLVTWTTSDPFDMEYKTSFTVGYEQWTGVTRLDVRHAISRLLEGKDGFATGNVDSYTSSSKTVVDANRIEPDDHWIGSYCYIYSGTGIGGERRVSDSTSSATSFVLGSAFSTNPAANSKYELHSKFSVEEINDAIKWAVVDVVPTALLPVEDDSLTITAGTYEYAIPAGLSHVFLVEVAVDAEDYYVAIAPAYWDIIRANRKLKFHPYAIDSYGSRTIRIRGLRPPKPPLHDNASLEIRPIFVIYKAAAWLATQRMLGSGNEPGGWSQKKQMFEALAESERAKMNKSLPNNTKKVEM